MPLLDVNDAFAPEMLDKITVHRITESIDGHGRVVRAEQHFDDVAAVVTMATPNDLLRLPEEEHSQKAITIFSPAFRLQGIVSGYTHPDEVEWHGSRFVVKAADDYSGFGRGYTSVVAVSVGPQDGPPL